MCSIPVSRLVFSVGDSASPLTERAHNGHGSDAPPRGCKRSFLFGGAESVPCTLATKLLAGREMSPAVAGVAFLSGIGTERPFFTIANGL